MSDLKQQKMISPVVSRNDVDFKRKIKHSVMPTKGGSCRSTMSEASETGSLSHRLRHAQSILTALENLRKREELCDVVLKISETEIKAHRVILAAVSPYFNVMFTGDLAESKKNVVELNNLDASAVSIVVEFAYVAQANITTENVESLLTVASFLQVQSLVEKCCRFLDRKLQPSNCLGIRRFALMNGCFTLGKTAYQYAMRHFIQTTQLEEFLQCSLEEVLELLSEDALYVRHEEEVYEAAVRWLRYSPGERSEKIPMLVEIIRFPLMAWEFLVTRVVDDGFITSNSCTRHLFEEARTFHLNSPLNNEVRYGSRLRPRKLYGQAEWIYVVGGETSPGKYKLVKKVLLIII